MEVINNIFVIIRDVIAVMLGFFLPPTLVEAIIAVLVISVFLGFMTVNVMMQVWAERKTIAYMQDRFGPNRVGPFGLMQSVADAVKLLTKEDIIPTHADKWVFRLGPIIVVSTALMVYGVMPFGDGMVIADLNIGILFAISIASIGTIGFLMSGWSSNNKYALLGAMRAVAQMVSYEIPLVLSIIGVVMLVGSLQMSEIVKAQSGLWFVIWQPLGFVIFFIAGLAEINRTPFDMVEADSEIVAGYFIEYSGMRFAVFYLAEYMSAFASAAIAVTLFFGGWQGPLLPPYIWFLLKVWLIFFVMIWIRATLPRVRVDQLMGFAWKVLIPLALLNIFLTGAILQPWYQGLVQGLAK
ncbi:MAG: NADH-quinone oxidoreductase subunit NuoH [Chloroflexi bacterium]|nr:NADH-quinone oxidoreductase subunit NuoH [Chloroflexota bacterium]